MINSLVRSLVPGVPVVERRFGSHALRCFATDSKEVQHHHDEVPADVHPSMVEEYKALHVHKTEPSALYGHVREHFGNPRSHLWEDGTRRLYSRDFHWYDQFGNVAPQKFVKVDGQTFIKGVEPVDLSKVYRNPVSNEPLAQVNLPFTPRERMAIFANYELIQKAEFLFFWIPTIIVLSMAVPCFTMIYMSDEAIYTTMTVKVIGRQWYWVYEVESPIIDDEDDE